MGNNTITNKNNTRINSVSCTHHCKPTFAPPCISIICIILIEIGYFRFNVTLTKYLIKYIIECKKRLSFNFPLRRNCSQIKEVEKSITDQFLRQKEVTKN